jgi:hypothetical protein
MPTNPNTCSRLCRPSCADPRVEQVRLHSRPTQRYCVVRDAPTRVVTLPSLPLTHLCHPCSSCRKVRVCSQESLSGAALQAHRTRLGAQIPAADMTPLGGRWRACGAGAVLGWGGGRR